MRMDRRSVVLLLTVAGVLMAGAASAQSVVPPAEDMGVIARVDTRYNVLILEDGRMLRVTPATVILAGGVPATVGALQPGSPVVVRGAERVTFRNGQYVLISDSPAASIPLGGVRSRTFGRVTDIDRDGDIKIETASGAFHVKVSPDAARTLKDGDSVTVDVMITPPAPTTR